MLSCREQSERSCLLVSSRSCFSYILTGYGSRCPRGLQDPLPHGSGQDIGSTALSFYLYILFILWCKI